MNNPLQLIQMLKGNPQQMMNMVMNNPQFANNPMIKNAMEMAQRGDEQGLKELAYNIGKQKGIDVDQMFNQVKGFK